MPRHILGADEPIYAADCPFFLRWSIEWQTCVIQWNTFYGLTIALIILGIIVTVATVLVWKRRKRHHKHKPK